MASHPTMMVATDLAGVITSCNSAADQVFGYSAGQMVGAKAWQLFEPAPCFDVAAAPLSAEPNPAAPPWFQSLPDRLRDDGAWCGPATLYGAKGLPLPVRLELTAMLDRSGKPSGYLCLARFDCHKPGSESELELARELPHIILEAIPHPAYLKNSRGVYIDCNTPFATFLALPKERIVGCRPGELPSSEIRCVQALAEATPSASAGPARHKTLPRTDGSLVTLLFNEVPLPAAAGFDPGVVGVVLDLTRQIRAEQESLLQATMLEDEVAKHQRAEEALREREKMLSLVINAVPQNIYWKDTESFYLGCNEQFARLAGLASPDEVVGKTDYDLPWTVEESDDYRRDDQEVMRDDRAKYHSQETQQQADGNWVTVDSTKIPLHDDCGSVVGLLGVYEDITKRTNIERELRQSEERLSAIFDASRAGIVLVAPDGTISFANRRMAEMFGVAMEDLLGSRYGSWLHPDEHGEEMSLAARILTGELASITVERHYRRADGSDFWGYLSGRRLHNADGSLQAQVGCIADVTELKTSKTALQREKERLAVTLRSIGDGVITVDTAGKVVLMNRVAEELCGYRQEEAAGLQLDLVFCVVDERTKARKDNSVAQVLRSGEVVEQTGQELLVARDGKQRLIASKAAPILDRDHTIPGVVLVFRDITEQREIEEELFKARKLESLGILAGGIAHDFNNLLTGIMGNIALARVNIPDSHEAALFLDRSHKGTERAKELAQQLLTFSKGGAPIKKLTSIGHILTDSAVFALRGSNVRCDFDIATDLWCAEIDAGQMSQVISNLVINADQAMPDGGSILIRAENVLPLDESDQERRIRITIKDTGSGISDEDLGRIYDPYFSTKATGNGLGLATVYAIVKNHDGEIRVFSRLNHGTTFAITLPAQPGSAPPPPQVEPGPTASGGKILLMDDESAIREMAAAALSMFGYQPVVACDGEEMLELYLKARQEGAPFDAVIMDLTVPGGMGGKEAVKRLLELDPDALAIASSGYSEDQVMANYADYGFTGIVSKPYSLQDLDIALQEMLAERRRR